MSSDRAPVIATWLVDRFCGDSAIAGDLIEQYLEGRSTLWYWKQSLIAIGACSVSRVWEHKWLAIRAIATGWLFSLIVIRMGMRQIVHPWWDAVAPPALYPLVASFAWLVNGWLVGRLHRPYSTAMVGVYAVWLIARNVSPLYASAMDALAGVEGSAFGFELWSRAESVLVMVCGGVLCAYCDQLLRARRSRLSGETIGHHVSMAES
ncbi:MAG TPA: hypothetical protein VLV86_18670 [Vicinamibacterales bacterium]|nr:hypothetical protein [Vicinamibacterales bacterium]